MSEPCGTVGRPWHDQGIRLAGRLRNDWLGCYDRHIDPDGGRLGNIGCKSNLYRKNRVRKITHRNDRLRVRVLTKCPHVRRQNKHKHDWHPRPRWCSLRDWEPWRVVEVVLGHRVGEEDLLRLEALEPLV